METTRVNEQGYTGLPTLLMALEICDSRWHVQFRCAGGTRERRKTVAAWDRQTLKGEIERAKARLGLPPQAPVLSCYEAGRDAFSIHRWLLSIGVDSRVVDSASIEVSQRAKRVKTDRVDLGKLMALLARVHSGELHVWHEVRVPSEEDEDRRRLHRERERLLKERTALGNRIGSLLATQGLRLALKPGFAQELQQLRRWDGQPLPAQLCAELLRMWQRRQLISQQVVQLERQRRSEILHGGDERSAAMRALMRLFAVGVDTAWLLDREILGWRQIANRRQLGALCGMTPTPYASGDSLREQGISGAGNRRVRTAAVELAWRWLRLQPDSDLAKWFMSRFGTGSKRIRRIGIVALARKLLVALWRYHQFGVIPAGARFKPAGREP
ncbi:IS110 family transposase [Polaromonas sp.]|uniref:IS110 family transposase n=1 Tax=Polaromonas sp. TaxID=1869339 RepID=UPI002FCB131D